MSAPLLTTLLVLAAGATNASGATDAPDPILSVIDDAARRAPALELELEVRVHLSDGSELTRALGIWQQGDRRLVRFTAPARLRGTSLLVPERGRLYVYLPAYGRPREITGRGGANAFGGTGLTMRELALVRLARTHRAREVSSDESARVVEARPRRPDDHDYALLRLRVRKADDLIERVEYVAQGGAIQRTLELADFRDVGGYSLPHRLVSSRGSGGRRTVATVRRAAVHQGFDGSRFTLRELSRRR